MKIFEVTEQKRVDTSSIVTPDLKEIFAAFERNGFDIKIAGGAVRDLLLGKEPKDIDMATTATPDQMKQVLRGFRTIDTGLQHGTITVLGRDEGEEFEITTLRIDKNHDGRHADVEWTTDFRQDAERRDLTFNAMFMDLDGTVHDFHGGQDDLKTGTARFVGNAQNRIEEDFLRILRFFRFQGRMPFPQWDEETLTTIRRTADGLNNISGERVWAEMQKILSGNHTIDILDKMIETGVAKAIGMPTSNMTEVERVKRITDNHNMLLAALIPNESSLDRVRKRWKFSNEVMDFVSFIVANRDVDLTLDDAKKMATQPKAKPKRIRSLLHFQGKPEIANALKKWRVPEFPITGKDLMARGMKGGKEMGAELARLRKEWEDQGFPEDFMIS